MAHRCQEPLHLYCSLEADRVDQFQWHDSNGIESLLPFSTSACAGGESRAMGQRLRGERGLVWK